MLPPDYQEFANRWNGRPRDNSVISADGTARAPKSARRCAIATLEIAPKYGTFR
jgi:hypothetical protein